MSLARIRKDDIVMIISGEDRPAKVKGRMDIKTGKVIKVLPKENKAIVEGINTVKEFKRRQTPTPTGGGGGIVEVEAPVALSKLKLICQSCNNPTKIRVVKTAEGKKVRMCRKCGKPVKPED